MPFEFTLEQLVEKAKLAKAQYDRRRGKMLPHRDGDFFSFPVCQNADGLFRDLTTRQKSDGGLFTHHSYPDIPFGQVARLHVRGIARWIDGEPDEMTVEVLVKNPTQATGATLNHILGVRNAIARVGNRLLVGGVVGGEVYILRPVAKKYARDLMKKIR